jgi:hypothetical protein
VIRSALFRIIDSSLNSAGEVLLPAGLNLYVWRKLRSRWYACHDRQCGPIGTSWNPITHACDVILRKCPETGLDELLARVHLADHDLGRWAGEEIEAGWLGAASISFLPVETMVAGPYKMYEHSALHEISLGEVGLCRRAVLLDVEAGMPHVSHKFFQGGGIVRAGRHRV